MDYVVFLKATRLLIRVFICFCLSFGALAAYGQTDTIRVPKQFFNVAVILPFKTDKVDPKNPSPIDRAVFELIQGMEIARCQLADSGIGINLMMYDTKSSPVVTNSILNEPELKKADAIIGPVSALSSPAVAEFALKNKILMLNPLSTKLVWDNANDYAILGASTPATIARKAAAYALKNFPSEKVGIIYGPNERDSVIAAQYRQIMIDSGKTVVLIHKVGKNSAANLTKFISKSGLDSTGHLFVPNNEKSVRVQLIGAVQGLKINTPILTWGNWIEEPTAIYELFEQANVHFFWPDGFIVDNPDYQIFKSSFAKKFNKIASEAAAAGFEDLWLIGKGLSLVGKEGLKDWVHQPKAIKAKLIGGYQYNGANDNQVIPFFKFVDEVLIPMKIED
jgi:ABC-type branched-subunit amino acid transport system substrate-binding protein